MSIQALYKNTNGDVSIALKIGDDTEKLYKFDNDNVRNQVCGENPVITDDEPPYPSGEDIKDGSNITVINIALYLQLNGILHHIDTPEILTHYQLNGEHVPLGDKIYRK